MTSTKIREQFIEFFKQRGHAFVPSSPVVPLDDPTLLFTNAGMNQFKPIFLGQEKRAYTRAVNTQKCIRAGGKHNDLDDVGRSRRHHTFFEMLGNWSFGDYFKQGAIEMSWELLTKVWKLDPTRLHVSCYEGDEKAGIPRDTEAANIWRKVANWEQYGLKSDDFIHYFGKDNFWEMGDTGPCGPCTEIYYDRTPDKTGGPQVNGEDPRVMEIWNNVFIQYNRDASGKLTELPAQHVDTGMGFERICQVLQDVGSNYDIDLFNPFWEKLKELSGHTYGGKFPKTNSVDAAAEAADEGLRKDIAFRVIADHVRCLTFAITDGADVSNEGRGYVLRRVLRRAVRFGRQQLGLKEPFINQMVSVVVDAMGGAFPELKKNPQRVVTMLNDEEIGFARTLDRGIELFEEAAFKVVGEAYAAMEKREFLGVDRETSAELSEGTNDFLLFGDEMGSVGLEPQFVMAELQSAGVQVTLLAKDAFKLHDTFGFPIDLTRIMAEERGMSVDIAGYEKLMEEAREKARAGGKENLSSIAHLSPDALSQLAQMGVKATDDRAKFVDAPLQAKVMAIWDGSTFSSPVQASEDQEIAVILDRTNFYSEMGGQVGDVGTITAPTSLDLESIQRADRSVVYVQSTKVVGGYVLHIGRLRSGMLAVGETVVPTVDDQRALTQKNHTTTHIANWALREVLGEGVQQKGSLVDPEKLRFDFSHGKGLELPELAKVESLVNDAIGRELNVYAQEAPQEQALKINGLRAVFGEKYPPMVRVVSVGVPVDELLKDPGNAKWRQYSIEFCGGTHLKSATEAKAFRITEESSVSKGIRRIVGVTGDAAVEAGKVESELDALVKAATSSPEEDIPTSIATINLQLKALKLPLLAKRRGQAAVVELQAKYKAWEKVSAASGASSIDVAAIAAELLELAVDVGGGKLIVGNVPGAKGDQLSAISDSLRKRTTSVALMLGSADETKVSFVAAVSPDLIAKGLKAGDWIRETAKIAGGGGGGQPGHAMAGGKDPSKLADALETARAYANKLLGG